MVSTWISSRTVSTPQQLTGVARRSCQTALYHIVEALTRWIAPILSFTADEILEQIPGEHDESVLLGTWYENLAELPEGEALDVEFWNQVMAVKTAVNKEYGSPS